MNVRYMGVYWISRKDELPEDAIMCVFHIKRTKPYRICFGGYSEQLKKYWDKVQDKWYDEKNVDYWMAIPILPTEEGVRK